MFVFFPTKIFENSVSFKEVEFSKIKTLFEVQTLNDFFSVKMVYVFQAL